MKLPLHLLTLVVFMAAANHAFGDVVNNTSDGERLARCLKAYLPKGWAFKDATPGPQEVPMRRGEKPEGCRIRFEGSQVIMAPPGKEYLEIFVLPRQNPMKKDLFIMDWFRPNKQKTVLLWRNSGVVILGNGAHVSSWKTWKHDTHNVLRDLGGN